MEKTSNEGAKRMVRLRVREVAQEKGVSIHKLSRMSDVSLTTVRKLVNDPTYSVTTATLEKIANALNVGVRDLLEETDVPGK
jgi:DNA-binding Xre family transcriptional regulator